MSILSENVSDRLQMIRQQIPAIEKTLKKAPEGRLRVSTSKNYTRFYIVEESSSSAFSNGLLTEPGAGTMQLTEPGAGTVQLTESEDGNLHLTEPEAGTIQLTERGNRNSSGRYLRLSERKLAEQLAQKDYDRQVLKLLKQEEKLLGNLEKYYKKTAGRKKRMSRNYDDAFFTGPEELLWGREKEARKQMVMPLVPDTESYVQDWLSESFVKKGFRDSDPEYYTGSGIRVRSKTELIIAEMLEKKEIPFYYERPLYLDGLGIVHPDFTVLNKKRRKTMYWEHMGMMDDENYCDYALKRIDHYNLAGFFPGRNLILTHETAARPIRTGILEKVIEEYLLW